MPEIEPRSTNRILNCLALAIDETKLMRTIKSTKEMVEHLREVNPQSGRLIFLTRQIPNLEKRLVNIRKQANGK